MSTIRDERVLAGRSNMPFQAHAANVGFRIAQLAAPLRSQRRAALARSPRLPPGGTSSCGCKTTRGAHGDVQKPGAQMVAEYGCTASSNTSVLRRSTLVRLHVPRLTDSRQSNGAGRASCAPRRIFLADLHDLGRERRAELVGTRISRWRGDVCASCRGHPVCRYCCTTFCGAPRPAQTPLLLHPTTRTNANDIFSRSVRSAKW